MNFLYVVGYFRFSSTHTGLCTLRVSTHSTGHPIHHDSAPQVSTAPSLSLTPKKSTNTSSIRVTNQIFSPLFNERLLMWLNFIFYCCFTFLQVRTPWQISLGACGWTVKRSRQLLSIQTSKSGKSLNKEGLKRIKSFFQRRLFAICLLLFACVLIGLAIQ